jgi:hypothetical protein
MRQDHFEYRPTFKLVIVGNERPRIPNVDAAIQRRLDFIPFTHQPAQPDPTLKERLKSEYPAILRWMIDGAAKMLKSGLPRPAIVQIATGEYLAEEDLRALWFAEAVERSVRALERVCSKTWGRVRIQSRFWPMAVSHGPGARQGRQQARLPGHPACQCDARRKCCSPVGVLSGPRPVQMDRCTENSGYHEYRLNISDCMGDTVHLSICTVWIAPHNKPATGVTA